MKDQQGRSFSAISAEDVWGDPDQYLVVQNPGWPDPEEMTGTDEAEAYATNTDLPYRPLLAPGGGTPLNELDNSDWIVVGGDGEVFSVHNFRVYVEADYGDPEEEVHQLDHSLEAFEWAAVPGVGELKVHWQIEQMRGHFDPDEEWLGLWARIDGQWHLRKNGTWAPSQYVYDLTWKQNAPYEVPVHQSKQDEVVKLVERATAHENGTINKDFFEFWAAPDTTPEHEPEFDPIEMGLRLLEAVALLHEQGQQNLRVLTGLSGSGMYWRFHLCPASNIEVVDEHLELVDWDKGLTYSTGEEWVVAGTKTSPSTSVEELAQLISRAAGPLDSFKPDPAYVAWFKELTETAKKLRVLPVAFSDFYVGPGFEMGSNVVFKLPPRH